MTPQPSWQYLAEQASNEMDPNKLSELISELCSAIDHERTQKTQGSDRIFCCADQAPSSTESSDVPVAR